MTITRKRISAEAFRRMAEAGVFGEGERLELLEGEIVEMTPISKEHARAVRKLSRWLQVSLGETAVVDSQNPLLLPGDNELYPDVAVLRPRPDDYRDLPKAEDVLLVIEVAKTSARYDLGNKRWHYAASDIPEYWVVDLDSQQVHVHRQPRGNSYLESQTLTTGDALEFLDAHLNVSDLF